MTQDLCLAISGTPGTGKTSLCRVLKERGYRVEQLASIAEANDSLGEVGEDGAAEVDIHKLADEWSPSFEGISFVDGHLAHFLEVEGIVVLRAKPQTITERLGERGYSSAKVQANAEWELLNGIWSELLEFEIVAPVLELVSEENSPEELADKVLEWIESGLESDSIEQASAKSVDWMS